MRFMVGKGCGYGAFGLVLPIFGVSGEVVTAGILLGRGVGMWGMFEVVMGWRVFVVRWREFMVDMEQVMSC